MELTQKKKGLLAWRSAVWKAPNYQSSQTGGFSAKENPINPKADIFDDRLPGFLHFINTGSEEFLFGWQFSVHDYWQLGLYLMPSTSRILKVTSRLNPSRQGLVFHLDQDELSCNAISMTWMDGLKEKPHQHYLQSPPTLCIAIWAIPENREFQKWKLSFFCQRHTLSTSFDIFVITYRVKNFLPKLVHKLLFSTEKTEFLFLVFPYFRVMPHQKEPFRNHRRWISGLHIACGVCRD